MKHTTAIAFSCAALLLSLTGAAPASAQDVKHEMPAASADAAPLVSGEIRKVDIEAGKITIRHAEIPNLEMPPMTMVFRAVTPDLLEQVKAGDQVLFSAEKLQGALTVTRLQAVTKK